MFDEVDLFLTGDARWCNGSTTDSDSVCLGSSPDRAAMMVDCVAFSVVKLEQNVWFDILFGLASVCT